MPVTLARHAAAAGLVLDISPTLAAIGADTRFVPHCAAGASYGRHTFALCAPFAGCLVEQRGELFMLSSTAAGQEWLMRWAIACRVWIGHRM